MVNVSLPKVTSCLFIFPGYFKTLSVHLPTLFLVIGYPVYWLELYFFNAPKGRTTPLAWIFFMLAALLFCWVKRQDFIAGLENLKKEWRDSPRFKKGFLLFNSLIILGIFLCIFYEALLPPHLCQEADFINYHLTLPRQHLIVGSLRHISWSTADLYLSPIDYALAPYWLVTSLPNKFPQLLFFLGLGGVAASMVRFFGPGGKNFWGAFLVIVAVWGSHGIGIQAGTGMLDVVLVYLFVAALDSFLRGFWILGAVEITFYFWSKSFMPIQVVVIAIGMALTIFVFKKLGFKCIQWLTHGPGGKNISAFLSGLPVKKYLTAFFVLSVFIAGPFVGKSLYYAGTPLYPFKPGLFPVGRKIDQASLTWVSLVQQAEKCMLVKDYYGSGRSPKEFLRHVWLIAVPEKGGTNNRYDYPLGLMYLLFLAPFFHGMFLSFKNKEIPLIPLCVCMFWLTWWLGSHQARFLYVPLVLMFISGTVHKRYHTKTLMVAMSIAILLVSVSVLRAYKQDFGRWGYEVLQEPDKEFVRMSGAVNRSQPFRTNNGAAAFADFEVEVVDDDSAFTLQYE